MTLTPNDEMYTSYIKDAEVNPHRESPTSFTGMIDDVKLAIEIATRRFRGKKAPKNTDSIQENNPPNT